VVTPNPTGSTPGQAAPDGAETFSLVRGDWFFRIQRAIGLIPADGGLGVGRRAVLLALVTWLPVAVWAYLTGRAFPGRVNEPLLEHFGVHVRCLVAIPLFILGEATVHAVSTRLVPYFLSSGLVPDDERGRFVAVVRRTAALRDASLPWMLMAGLVLAWIIVRPTDMDVHELDWAIDADRHAMGFGGWWLFYVARPIFTALLLAWLWRLVLLGVLLRRIAGLRLSIVPSHPDRTGGLGFLEQVPAAFAPVVIAIAAVLASRWAHDVEFHDVALDALKMPAAIFLVTITGLVLAPLVAFSGPLRRARKRGVLDYAALVGEHGRRVHRKWILRQPVDDRDELLSAPELGPVADTTSLYESVARMRTTPIGKKALLGVLIPAMLPMIAVVAIRVPLKQILLTLLKTLV
jgi:hypothetical protein